MHNKLFVVCLLLAVAAELMEGRSAFQERKVQRNSMRSHIQVDKRRSEVHECDSNKFLCNDKRKCIPFRSVCDGYPHCRDRSDEPGDCRTRQCPDGYLKCRIGQCLNRTQYCTGKRTCAGEGPLLSEADCRGVTCPEGTFQCQSNGICISNSSRCNGNNDCADGSDEADCPPIQCQSGYAPCPKRIKCIKDYYLCDSDSDCGDGSDEAPEFCDGRQCAEDEIRCDSGQCLKKNRFCKGEYKCRDGSRINKDQICRAAPISLPEQNTDVPVEFLCMSGVQQECRAPDLEQQFGGLQDPGQAITKLAQMDLREICTPVREFRDCALTSFGNNQHCQVADRLLPDLRLKRELASNVFNYVCEEHLDVINREKSCLLKLNEQNQPVMMFKLMMSCAPHIIALQSNPQQEIFCIPAELQQCAKNTIAEECGEDIATVANGLADLVQDFCREMQTLRSRPPTHPVEQPSHATYVKRLATDYAKVRRMLKSLF